MRSMGQFTHRPLSLLFLGFAVAAACETTTAPDVAPAPWLGVGARVAEGLAKHGATSVPFSARGTFDPAGSPIICTGVGPVPSTYIGTGVMSHLGKSTFVVTWQTCGLNAQGRLVASGVFAVTAANGDALEGTLTQTFTPVTPTFRTFVFHPLTITGGTGRFAGVTGYAHGSGLVDEVAQRREFEFTGEMTPPGMSKHSSP